MACPVANRLLKRYSGAVSALLEAQAPLLTGILAPEQEFRQAFNAAIEAHSIVDAARREFWEHIQTHGCRQTARRGYPRAAKERLQEEMLKVRAVFDSAFEKYDYLMRLSAD